MGVLHVGLGEAWRFGSESTCESLRELGIIFSLNIEFSFVADASRERDFVVL